MRRSLALACVLGGCGFSASVDGGGMADARKLSSDAAIDAPVDAMTSGAEAMPGPVTMAFTSAADVYLRTGASPDENTNDRDYFIVDGDVVATGLVAFNISAIPTTATVMSADLMLYDDGDPGNTVTVHQLLQLWDEATATSNQRAAGMAWAAAGAAPPSRSATACGSFTPSTSNTTYTIPITASVVQGWVTTPTTNFGFAIVTTNSDGSRFAARERATASQRPALRVTYMQ